jgi:glutaredoxin 3
MKVKIYGTNYCPFCINAIKICEQEGFEFENIDVTNNPQLRQEISIENGNYATVPMIFIDDKFIGGFSEFRAHISSN